ncbi:hypothetical protein [Microbacterium sp. HJ5]
MSTTGNEFEQPGVNYPDRQDAAGAEATPGAGEPQRDDATDASPTSGGHLEAADEGVGAAPTTSDGPAQDAEPAAAAAAPPSHQAIGIGVVDGSDHHGQDEGRDTLTVGEAQRTDGGLGSEQEQRLPAMSQNDASALDKVSGIVAQTRADVGTEPVERIAEVLHQRLEQAGVDLPDGDVDELARQISTGDAAAPDRP